jgi:hypothetical protein
VQLHLAHDNRDAIVGLQQRHGLACANGREATYAVEGQGHGHLFSEPSRLIDDEHDWVSVTISTIVPCHAFQH